MFLKSPLTFTALLHTKMAQSAPCLLLLFGILAFYCTSHTTSPHVSLPSIPCLLIDRFTTHKDGTIGSLSFACIWYSSILLHVSHYQSSCLIPIHSLPLNQYQPGCSLCSVLPCCSCFAIWPLFNLCSCACIMYMYSALAVPNTQSQVCCTQGF